MTESIRFDLVEEPWIPVVTSNGGLAEVGLREALVRAHEFVELVGDTPLETVGLHRLLLAMLHRCFGPESAGAWRRLQEGGHFDDAAVNAYLDRWHQRFNLFDTEHPFYQTPGLPADKAGSIAKLQFHADNNPTLFHHGVVSRPPLIRPAQAARLLVAFQSFDTTGTKTAERGQESAKAAPLVQAAVTMHRGDTLFETLLLNLHRYAPESAQPWTFDRKADDPCWEREDRTGSVERVPRGYLDLLTWQSRRVLLFPAHAADGEVYVPKVVIMTGFAFPPALERRAWETMVAYLKRRNPQPNQPAYYPLGFREDRALWRDSLALLATASATEVAPKLARWLLELEDAGALPLDFVARVEVAGLATDKAKCLFWRHERIRLPTAVMRDPAAVERVRNALTLAESAARIVASTDVFVIVNGKLVRRPSAVRAGAETLVAGSQDRRALVQQLSKGRVFWSTLDAPFVCFLDALPLDILNDDFGNRIVGATAMRTWRESVGDALDTAFTELVSAFGASGAGLRAAATAERTFIALKRDVLSASSAVPQTAEVEG